jgi:hypothetical protein
LAGLISEFIYLRLAVFDAVNGPTVFTFIGLFAGLFVLYFATGFLARTLPGSWRVLCLIAFFGLIFRFTLVPAGLRADLPAVDALKEDLQGHSVNYEPFLLYDQDVWRYLWEGHVWAEGGNPYGAPPDDASLDHLAGEGLQGEVWGEIRERVTFADLPALYPPAALVAFGLSYSTFPGSVAGWKLWLILFEVLSGVFIILALRALHQPLAPGLLLFVWNPLLIKSFAGSAHFDALVVLFLSVLVYAVASRRPLLQYVSLGLATLSKLVPAVLLPLLGAPLLAGFLLYSTTVFSGYLPFLGSMEHLLSTGFTFANHWRFNSGPYAFVETLAGPQLALVLYLGSLVLAAYFLRRFAPREGLGRINALLWMLGLAIVLGPVVNPWYVTWLIPMACITRSRAWLGFSALVFFAFFIMLDGVERTWIVTLEYLIFGGIIWMDRPFRKESANAQTSDTVSSFSSCEFSR